MLVSSEHSEGLISRYSSLAEKENHQLIPIEFGTLNQLRNLVHLVSTGEVRACANNGIAFAVFIDFEKY